MTLCSSSSLSLCWSSSCCCCHNSCCNWSTESACNCSWSCNCCRSFRITISRCLLSSSSALRSRFSCTRELACASKLASSPTPTAPVSPRMGSGRLKSGKRLSLEMTSSPGEPRASTLTACDGGSLFARGALASASAAVLSAPLVRGQGQKSALKERERIAGATGPLACAIITPTAPALLLPPSTCASTSMLALPSALDWTRDEGAKVDEDAEEAVAATSSAMGPVTTCSAAPLMTTWSWT
mmetsp:Transcript_60875/g.133822  ORF Transcript_60875/g.133822 Transcript_60875/m.133822 type:complete len:241 (+) Transcript_60875:399-1121(+)